MEDSRSISPKHCYYKKRWKQPLAVIEMMIYIEVTPQETEHTKKNMC